MHILSIHTAKVEQVLQLRWLLVTVVVLGMVLRLLAAARGHNFDFESFIIVADIARDGGNVYADTLRYNYGPIWFLVIQAIVQLAVRNEFAFRYLIVILLSLVDVGIFAILLGRLGALAAYLFLLNPISIMITGYHSQFDNLAILLGLVAVTFLDEGFDKPPNKRRYLGLLILGLSLMVKHILFVFPLWLAIKERGIKRKLEVIFLPLLVFLLGFVPYWHEGREGIIENVFLYSSFNNQLFYKWLVPASIQLVLTSKLVWIFLLASFAIIYRQRNGFDSLLLYTCLLVAASPAVANQYLAIVVPFVVAKLNPLTILYTVIGTWFLLVNHDGLHIYRLQQLINIADDAYYLALVFLLTSALVWATWPQQIVAFLNRTIHEAKIQLGFEQ